ncbi:hypothetical protein FYK55_24475 [Roseiconus nitratireducens]|uniref:Uncharacterized protein n=1 Tax=Roseiconus nitratireducens TaxID=2605748 RepID=A0A5M6CW98_9BACT|nr:hypothetical protein [Roseiconus nitratireducens]KAA5539491.1 hypothetical protein FYK55_24475 [Roseiconus nitratireducens]
MNDVNPSRDEQFLSKNERTELAARSSERWLSEAKLGMVLPVVAWITVPIAFLLIALFGDRPKNTGPVDQTLSYVILAAGLPPSAVGLCFASMAFLKKRRWLGSLGILLALATGLIVMFLAWIFSQRWRMV